MNVTRAYRMAARAAASEVTRERILDAACDAFLTSWYDDVTLREVAAAADVALQTVVNHFGTKEALYGAAVQRISDAIEARRYDVEPGDVRSEEHTSELQSRQYLVCRLLLEKKQ